MTGAVWIPIASQNRTMSTSVVSVGGRPRAADQRAASAITTSAVLQRRCHDTTADDNHTHRNGPRPEKQDLASRTRGRIAVIEKNVRCQITCRAASRRAIAASVKTDSPRSGL